MTRNEVIAAVAAGKNLRGADLGGAYLRGAYLGGTKEKPERVISAQAGRCYRSDSYEFIAFKGFEGSPEVIRAGCRTFSLAEFRTHTESYTSATKRAETLEILDFLERQLNREAWS